MRQLTLLMIKLTLLLSFSLSVNAAEDNSKLIKAMQSGSHILMLRHAIAPGFGDPENIKIGDCDTQRNLDNRGREQSIQIGNWLRKNNIKPKAIYSSQWCRCLETARLLDLGEVKELSALNSFFEMPQNRESDLKSLKTFINKQVINQNLIIMVTHSVTISAISGQSVASGNGVLLKLNSSGSYEFIAAVNPGKIK